MTNKNWDEVRAELMESPSFKEEYLKLQPADERVRKYINARKDWSSRGLTQKGLASRAKVPYSLVLMLEDMDADISSIDPDALGRIHSVLNIS